MAETTLGLSDPRHSTRAGYQFARVAVDRRRRRHSDKCSSRRRVRLTAYMKRPGGVTFNKDTVLPQVSNLGAALRMFEQLPLFPRLGHFHYRDSLSRDPAVFVGVAGDDLRCAMANRRRNYLNVSPERNARSGFAPRVLPDRQ